MPTHKEAIQLVLDALVNEKTGAIASLAEVNAVGHRIVHGGEKFASSAVITPEMLAAVEECNDLAPLHNPANLIGIHACQELMPGVPMVGVFEFLGKDLNDSKIIVAHLGNGASISAVLNGKCVDTSMGLTPLEGLVMGTRSGDIDPAIMEFIAKKENLDIAGVMNVLNKKSGVQGISGLSSDFRDLEEGMEAGNERATAAIEVFSYRVAKYIGSYVAAMNGVDVIAFTAGIGENAPIVRSKVLAYLGYLGITVDEEANSKRGDDIVISTPDSKVTVCVIPTNEELAIARETVALVK